MEPNLNQAVDTVQKQRAGTAELLAGQDTRSGDFLGKLGGYVSSQPSMEVMSQRIGAELGLPALRQNAASMQENLRALPDTYSKATTGFDVNANQLARVVGTKQAELAPAAQRASEQALNAEGELGRRLGYAENQFQRGLIPLNAEQGMLAERNARETSLYSQDNQNELSAIISKIQNGIQLSEAEKNRAHELSMAESNFERQKQLNVQQASLSQQSPDTQIIEVNGQKKLINTQTGQVISTYGSSSGGGVNPTSYLSSGSNASGYLSGGQTSSSNAQPQYSAAPGTIKNGWYTDGRQWYQVAP